MANGSRRPDERVRHAAIPRTAKTGLTAIDAPSTRLDDRDLAQVAVAIVLSKGSAVADARV